MTRRKKTKNASENASALNAPATTSCIAAKAKTTIVSQGHNPPSQHSSPIRQTLHSSTSSSPARSSIPRSFVPFSIASEAASTRNLDKQSKNHQQKKKPVNTKVTYVTEQIHIYPNYPVLTVERLPNLDYHINTLKESIGRRPCVYEHGKGVRFISELNCEYRTIQRYLEKIESSERIAWCSYTVPNGNSLKVNVKVRKVEFLKESNKLSLENGTNPSVATQKQSLHKDMKSSDTNSPIQNGELNTKGGTHKEVRVPSKHYSLRRTNITLKDFLPKDGKLSTTALSPTTSHQGLGVSSASNIGLNDKKKTPRDIVQNRSYQRTNIY